MQRIRHRTSRCAVRRVRPLPGGGDRPRIPRHHAGIEGTHINPEFEGVCGHDSKIWPSRKPRSISRRSPWQIPSTIAANGFRLAWLAED